MNVTETIQTFLSFFRDRGHQILPGSSLVPPQATRCCSPPRACTR
jgi:alanyl-tRNA synthetase